MVELPNTCLNRFGFLKSELSQCFLLVLLPFVEFLENGTHKEFCPLYLC